MKPIFILLAILTITSCDSKGVVETRSKKPVSSSNASYGSKVFSNSPYCQIGIADSSQDEEEGSEFDADSEEGFAIVGGNEVSSTSNILAKSTVKLHVADHICTATLIGPRASSVCSPLF